jgi:hypothetical protein
MVSFETPRVVARVPDCVDQSVIVTPVRLVAVLPTAARDCGGVVVPWGVSCRA